MKSAIKEEPELEKPSDYLKGLEHNRSYNIRVRAENCCDKSEWASFRIYYKDPAEEVDVEALQDF